MPGIRQPEGTNCITSLRVIAMAESDVRGEYFDEPEAESHIGDAITKIRDILLMTEGQPAREREKALQSVHVVGNCDKCIAAYFNAVKSLLALDVELAREASAERLTEGY